MAYFLKSQSIKEISMLGHELVYLKKPETQTQPKPKLQPIFLDLKKRR